MQGAGFRVRAEVWDAGCRVRGAACRVRAEVRAGFLGSQLLPDTEREGTSLQAEGGARTSGSVQGRQGGSLGLGRPGALGSPLGAIESSIHGSSLPPELR